MIDNFFIDTSIIVHAHDADFPEKQKRSQELIFTGLRERKAVISAQVLSELFIIITRKINQTYSVPAARHELMLLSYLEVIDIDYDLVIRATRLLETFQLSYWDGMIIAAAERADCGILYSEDFNHGQLYAGIRCENPFIEGGTHENC